MTREELLKSKVIKALSIAVSAKSTDGYEKMFLEQVAAEVSKYDVYSVNIGISVMQTTHIIFDGITSLQSAIFAKLIRK